MDQPEESLASSGASRVGDGRMCLALIFLNAPQISAITAGLVGSVLVWLFSRTSGFKQKPGSESASVVPIHKSAINFHVAFIPYYLLIFLALFIQLPAVKQATQNIFFAIDYPGVQTSLGYVVPQSENYAKIMLFGHPAPMILASILVTLIIFHRKGLHKNEIMKEAVKATFKQCWQPTLSIIAMVVMSLIMNDSGMTNIIAVSIAGATGSVYPLISPYIGVLGCFMTGSNASSNVMFGSLQTSAAAVLGISPLIIASAQSIGGSLGAAIAPAKVLLASSASGLGGKESYILRKTLVYCFIVTFIVGMECWLAVIIT
jgi:lactate permease